MRPSGKCPPSQVINNSSLTVQRNDSTIDPTMSGYSLPDKPSATDVDYNLLCTEEPNLIVSFYIIVESKREDFQTRTVNGISELESTTTLKLYDQQIQALKMIVNGKECK